jgi:hypothetical protein
VIEPSAQFSAGRERVGPFVYTGLFLRYPARPYAIDQHPITVTVDRISRGAFKQDAIAAHHLRMVSGQYREEARCTCVAAWARRWWDFVRRRLVRHFGVHRSV